MRITVKQIGVLMFVVWEVYWTYVFFSAPVPDDKMDSVFALLMAVVLPLFVVVTVALLVLGNRLGRRRRS